MCTEGFLMSGLNFWGTARDDRRFVDMVIVAAYLRDFGSFLADEGASGYQVLSTCDPLDSGTITNGASADDRNAESVSRLL